MTDDNSILQSTICWVADLVQYMLAPFKPVLIDVSSQQFTTLLQFLHHCEDHTLSYDNRLKSALLHFCTVMHPGGQKTQHFSSKIQSKQQQKYFELVPVRRVFWFWSVDFLPGSSTQNKLRGLRPVLRWVQSYGSPRPVHLQVKWLSVHAGTTSCCMKCVSHISRCPTEGNTVTSSFPFSM
jgi:hypothetical protein